MDISLAGKVNRNWLEWQSSVGSLSGMKCSFPTLPAPAGISLGDNSQPREGWRCESLERLVDYSLLWASPCAQLIQSRLEAWIISDDLFCGVLTYWEFYYYLSPFPPTTHKREGCLRTNNFLFWKSCLFTHDYLIYFYLKGLGLGCGDLGWTLALSFTCSMTLGKSSLSPSEPWFSYLWNTDKLPPTG